MQRGRNPLPFTKMKIPAAFVIWCLCLAQGFAAGPWEFETMEGKRFTPFADEKTKALVAVFIATDCPVANYFQPTLQRLQEKYDSQGVKFVFLHSDPSVTAEAARKHVADFSINIPVVLDPEFKVARQLKAEYTPEAFVISPKGEVKYRGRINDIYAELGKKRRQPRREDLSLAIASVLKGEAVAQPVTKPVGCYVPYPPGTEPKK